MSTNRRQFIARALAALGAGAWLGRGERAAQAGTEQPHIGEIRMFAGDFAPAGWMFCEGQLISIAENDQLFQVIGTTYGGDGNETFGLPDLRGRAPIHVGPGPGGITWALGRTPEPSP
jgi:hypothetical protein